MSYCWEQGDIYFTQREQLQRYLFSINEFGELYYYWEGRRGSRDDARIIENHASRLIASRFASEEDAYNLMEDVIIWTGDNRLLGRARENPHEEIADTLFDASEHVRHSSQERLVIALAEAVEFIKENLHGIDPTLASAHIRMMFPNVAGVRNQEIRDELGYGEELYDHIAFLEDLNDLKSMLDPWNRGEKIFPEDFRICDVEMIVYAALDRE